MKNMKIAIKIKYFFNGINLSSKKPQKIIIKI